MTFRAFLAGHDEIDGHGATEQVFYFIFFMTWVAWRYVKHIVFILLFFHLHFSLAWMFGFTELSVLKNPLLVDCFLICRFL
jgi:hypothetical protein